jgi:hypothetical protein
MLQQVQNAKAVSFREPDMLGLRDDGLGGAQSVPKHEIREVGVLERNGPKERRLFLGANPQGHPAIVFDRYSGHWEPPLMYAFK